MVETRRYPIVFEPPTFVSINENILGKCFRSLFVFHKSKNFTSDYEIRMPPTVPVNHYSDPEGHCIRTEIL